MSEENNNEEETDIHWKKFEEWRDKLPEERLDDVGQWLWTCYRRPDGALKDLSEFLYMVHHFITLEGAKALQAMKRTEENVCIECQEKHIIGQTEEEEEEYHKSFVRWKLSNKALMFDLYEFWYSQLLDETGELEDMDFTLFCIWKFTTVDGKFCQSEMEKEIMNDHRKNQQK